MAPIRRYLRITKYSVLEVRIYLDQPSLSETWLLRRGDPALPRIIESVRPLVLPKLREENERVKVKKGKRGLKDVVVGDDFEASVFLTDLASRHSLLTKHKTFEVKPRLKSNTSKLTSWLTSGSNDEPVVIRGEDGDSPVNLNDIPEAEPQDVNDTAKAPASSRRRNKRQRRDTDEGLFIRSSSGSEDSYEFQTQRTPPPKRSKRSKDAETPQDAPEDSVAEDDKKKLSMNTSYDGFSIYGRILCLVVKRKGGKSVGSGSGAAPASSGQQMMENWVSTQAAQDQAGDDEDEG